MIDVTNQYELFLTINGNRVFEYPHTDGNTYIESREGNSYSLNLYNKSHERAMFVVGVDGLNITNGKQEWEGGYSVQPHSNVVVDGWLTSYSSMSLFTFSNSYDSYASRSGKGVSNNGVIGAMVFREKIKQHMAYRGIYSSGANISTKSINTCNMSTANMGTSFGESINANVKEDSFEKRDPKYPDATMVLYYDSRRGLEKRGINFLGSPTAFPGYNNNKFCQKP